MAATRLALSMDESVAQRARRIAEARHTSISKLFVSFVCMIESEGTPEDTSLPPLTKKALGLGKGCVSPDWDYRDELAGELSRKYGVE